MGRGREKGSEMRNEMGSGWVFGEVMVDWVVSLRHLSCPDV